MVSQLLAFILGLLFALLITILVELSTAYIIGIRNKNIFKTIVFVNIITNPVMNVIMIVSVFFFGTKIGNSIWMVLLFEMGVVYVEYRFFRYVFQKTYRPRTVFGWSCLFNLSSFLVGLLLSYWEPLHIYFYQI